jgi:hypothetical protein
MISSVGGVASVLFELENTQAVLHRDSGRDATRAGPAADRSRNGCGLL